MKTTSLEAQPAAPVQAVEPLRVLVFYEDFTTGLRAKSLLDRVGLRLGQGGLWRVHWLRLDLLNEPAFAAESMGKVPGTDLIVISAHGSGKRYDELERWFAGWEGKLKKADRRGALVVSLDAGAEIATAGQRTMFRFRVLATRAGLPLFPHFSDLPVSQLLPSIANIREARAWIRR